MAMTNEASLSLLLAAKNNSLAAESKTPLSVLG
jgi:hypothetical protein